MSNVLGILFDKDGTLFDFSRTWSAVAEDNLHRFSNGDFELKQRLADAIRFDLKASEFLPDSIAIAGTNLEIAQALLPNLPDQSLEELEWALIESSAKAPLTPAVPLAPLLTELRGLGCQLGVMTNDAQAAAEAHLNGVDVRGFFNFVAGSDSGFGAKPDPGPLLAFADQCGLDAKSVAMVGDSTHDLIAGRRAGMQTVAVLTGLAEAEELQPWADVVLPDIGHLPTWIAA